MTGRGISRVLAVHSPDPVLSVVGPVGLAASAGTALVVDLENRLVARTGRSLAEILSDGPTRSELSPGRSGVAVLGAGPVVLEEAVETVGLLAAHWPAIVVRIGDLVWPGPTVPVMALYPGCLMPPGGSAAVWQSIPSGPRPPGPGPVLPRLRSGLVRLVLAGGLPRRSRWIMSWGRVWDMPWA